MSAHQKGKDLSNWTALNNKVARDWGKKPAWNKGQTKADQTDCPQGTKRCSTCLEIKDHGEYYKDKRMWDGYQARCKQCCKEARDPEQVRAYKRNWFRRQQEQKRRTALMVEMYQERQEPARIYYEEVVDAYV